jgi:hypothetical protein
VLVPAEDADAAREILDSTAVVQASDRPETNDATAIVCPRCGSDDVAPVTRGKRLAVLSWLIVSFPLFPGEASDAVPKLRSSSSQERRRPAPVIFQSTNLPIHQLS